MRNRRLVVAIALVLVALSITANLRRSQAQEESAPEGASMLFVENAGQWDAAARFQAWGGPGQMMWLAQDAIWITLLAPAQAQASSQAGVDPLLPSAVPDPQAPAAGVNVRLSFVGANPQPQIEAFAPRDIAVSYLRGSDPQQWRPEVPVWGGVRYADLYPGVALEITGEAGQPAYRLAAQPGADLGAVRLRVEGADAVAVDGAALRISTAAGELSFPLLHGAALSATAAVQPAGDRVFEVLAPFAAAEASPPAPAANPNDLLYGAFLGGGYYDDGYGIVANAAGNVFVAGGTSSSNFPVTPGAFDPSYGGSSDAFVAKLNAGGSALSYATFLGGSSSDKGYSLAIDGTGSAYVAGYTSSNNFPVTASAFDRTFNGGTDAFVAKLTPSGAGLAYSTFLGGNDGDTGYNLAVDAGGSVYVTGWTLSYNFPVTSGALDPYHNGNQDVFVARLDPAGSSLVFSTFLGGSSYDSGHVLALHSSGIYIAGGASAGFPTTPGAFDTSYNGCSYTYPWCDAFVAKLSSDGRRLIFSTYLGGSLSEWANGIAVDSGGNAVVTGPVFSSNFPVVAGAFDASHNGYLDIFVSKLAAAGNALQFSTFVGGNGTDFGNFLVLDGSNNAIVVGGTESSNFPTTANGFDRSLSGYQDAHLFKLRADGRALLYGSFLGGDGDDWGVRGSPLDSSGRTWMTGSTYSSNFPTTAGAFDRSYNGAGDAFVAKLGLAIPTGPTATPTATPTRTPTPTPTATVVTYSVSGRVLAANGAGIEGVTISDNAGRSAVTAANGSYTLRGLPAGTHLLSPAKNGFTFTPVSRSISVPPAANNVDFKGYDRPPIVFVHGWNGLNDSCDWVAPDNYFDQLDELLQAGGYYVAYANLESSSCFTPPIEDNVWRLDNAIQLAKAATHQPKVILIAHSMGGLVSRAYLEGADYDDDVAQVFTFGSPHQGVPDDLLAFFANGISLGAYCRQYQPAVCDFSYLGMLLFNLNHLNRADGVTYHVISGDAPFWPRTALGILANTLLAGPDDGAVQTSSGTGLGGDLDRWETDETHGSGSGPRNYFARDGAASISYLQCLKRVLVDRSTDRCGTVGPPEEASPAGTSPQRSPFLFGTLLPGQTANRSVPIEGGATVFAAQWQPGSAAMTLLSPSGVTIDPAYAAAHPDVVAYQAGDGFATYSFPAAAAGAWQVRVQAVAVPTGGAAYTIFASFDGGLALSAATDQPWYTPGSTALISATLSPAPQSASVMATVLLADSTSTAVALAPLGGGRYQASFPVPARPGYAEVRLAAAGVGAGGAAFERGATLAFQIAPNTIALDGNNDDTVEPRWPGAPIYQALVVTVGVNVSQNGANALAADLVDGAGYPVARAVASDQLPGGAGSLALRFLGGDIYASQRNGPYTVTNVVLTDQNSSTLLVQRAHDVHTTAAYGYRQFRTGDLFLPLLMR